MLEKFKNLQISDVIINALNDMGFEEPTPIQAFRQFVDAAFRANENNSQLAKRTDIPYDMKTIYLE